jgi:hypothetical protein
LTLLACRASFCFPRVVVSRWAVVAGDTHPYTRGKEQGKRVLLLCPPNDDEHELINVKTSSFFSF